MQRATLETMVALGLMGLSVAGAVHASGFPRGSAYLPTTVFVAMAILSLIWAVQSGIAHFHDKDRLRIERVEARRLAIIAFGALALAVAIPAFGFFTGFIVLVPGIAFVLGYRSARGLAVGALVFVGILYLFFVVILNRPLPAEIWHALLA